MGHVGRRDEGETPGSPADNAKGAIGIIDYASCPWPAVATWERANGAIVAATSTPCGTWAPCTRRCRSSCCWPRATLYWTGASWQFAQADTLILALYAPDVRNVPRVEEADPRMVVVSPRPALSRRTDLYVTAADAKAQPGQKVRIARDDPGAADTQRGLVVGMRHRF